MPKLFQPHLNCPVPHSGQFISSEWSAHSACPSHLHCSGMHPGEEPDDPEGEPGPPPRKSAADTDTENGAIPAWLPNGDGQIFRLFVFGPSGLKDYGSATLRCKI